MTKKDEILEPEVIADLPEDQGKASIDSPTDQSVNAPSAQTDTEKAQATQTLSIAAFSESGKKRRSKSKKNAASEASVSDAVSASEQSVPSADAVAETVPEKEEAEHSFDEVEPLEDDKPPKKLKVYYGLMAVSIVMIIMSVLGLYIVPLYQAYKDSYEYIPIITRDENTSYERPTLPPDVTIFPWESGSDIGTDDSDIWDDTEIEETTTPPPVTQPPATTTENKPSSSKGIYYVEKKNPNVETILLLGSDTRSSTTSASRTDAMMVISYNKKSGEVKLVSLLRDMLVPIKGTWNRLNAAFASGGVALCINTINEVFELDIQKYVIVDFSGVEAFVNKCGGVDMALSENEFEYIKKYAREPEKNSDGTYHLNGWLALTHMRNRKVGSDFSRTDRQRDVIFALYRKVIEEKNLGEILGLVEYGMGLVTTNIKMSELISMATSIVSISNVLEVTMDKLPCTGSWNYGTYGKKSVIIIDIDRNIDYIYKLLYR